MPGLVLVVVACGYLWEVVSVTGIPVARDMQMFFVPQKHLLADALRAGEIPLWTPYIGSGAPFLANVQSGVFYPPHWLYAILPFYTAFNLLIVAHFALGGVFAYLLGRRLGATPAAAYVGAASWMLGGYFASLLNLMNALQGAAWAPGLAWAAVGVLARRGPGRVAVLVAIAACAILAGEPQTFLLGSSMTLLVGLMWLREHRRPAGGWPPAIARLAVAGAVVVGLVAIQVVPTLEFLRVSGRGGGLTFGEAAAFDLDPVRLVYLFVPPDYRDPEYVFGVRSLIGRGDPWLFSVYLGAAMPLLVWAAWRNRSRRAGAVVWTAVAAFGLVVALGAHTPIFEWLFDHVPGFGSFRFPEKYVFLTAFASMMLATRGADALLADSSRRGDRVWAALYVGLPLVALAAFRLGRTGIRSWAMRYGNDRMFEDFDYVFGVWTQNIGKLALLAAILVALVWACRRGSLSVRWFAVLVCAVVTGDLLIAHRDLNPVVGPEFYREEPLALRHVPIEEVSRDYRYRSSRFDSVAGSIPVLRGIPLEAQKWTWQQAMGPNVGQVWGVLQQDAWDAIRLGRSSDERDLLRAIPDIERRWRLLRLHSVRYVHSLLVLDPAGEADPMPLDTLPGYLYEMRDPLPRAYFVAASETVPTGEAAVNRLLSAEFDPRASVVFIDSAGAPPARAPADSGAVTRNVEIVSFGGHDVRIRVGPGPAGFVVLTDADYPGWSARVDGVPAPIHLANYFFRGVEVPADAREVRFEYGSAAFERGRRWSSITLAIAILLLGGAVVRQRARAGPGAAGRDGSAG